MNQIIQFFHPPEYDNIERNQKARFLHYSLLLTSSAMILLGFQNIGNSSRLDLILFSLSALIFICIPLNKRGHYISVAFFLSGILIVAITFSLIVGIGLKDAGMLAYPSFILFASFFFGKREALISAMLSIASVWFVWYMDKQGKLQMAIWNSQTQAIIMSIMLAAIGVTVFLIVNNWRFIVDKLFVAYDSTLEGWAKALELRDKETEGHSQRVTELTLRVAEEMDVPKRMLYNIRQGALLHDIGKMAIPDNVLLKPGLLTTAERNLIEEHPLQAIAMLEDIPFLNRAQSIPRSHHERWDGSGYPDGLSGKEIPLEARIFAVVDVWDALISDRPYRPAWSHADAYRYILENAGILFDPDCVEAFCQVVIPPGD